MISGKKHFESILDILGQLQRSLINYIQPVLQRLNKDNTLNYDGVCVVPFAVPTAFSYFLLFYQAISLTACLSVYILTYKIYLPIYPCSYR